MFWFRVSRNRETRMDGVNCQCDYSCMRAVLREVFYTGQWQWRIKAKPDASNSRETRRATWFRCTCACAHATYMMMRKWKSSMRHCHVWAWTSFLFFLIIIWWRRWSRLVGGSHQPGIPRWWTMIPGAERRARVMKRCVTVVMTECPQSLVLQ